MDAMTPFFATRRPMNPGSFGLAGAAIALLLAGCGGQGAPANSASAAAPPPAAAAEAPSAAPVAGGADADAAKAFLVGVYAEYRQGDDADPALYTKPANYFDPPLAALIQTDNKRSKAGFQTALDYDALCDCQDEAGLHADVQVTSASATAATAVVTLTYPGPPPPGGPTKIGIDLAKAAGQWRIHDLHESDVPSLVALLTTSNATSKRINDAAP
jgi:hypothetical protein